MWRETTKHARNLKIFKEELDALVPEKILDFHVHIWPQGVVPAGQTFSCAGHPITHYDLRDFETDLAEVYPGRETSAVCFGFPNVDYDLNLNNSYIAANCDKKRFFPFRLFDPQTETAEKLLSDVESARFLGLKPYPDYVRKADINDTQIIEMLPDWAMDIANSRGLIIMLHIPRKQRLADPLNQRQIVELCKSYPRVKIILAHIGRAYYLKNIVGQLDNLVALPNLYFDISMLNNWEVLEYLFQKAKHDRILYGTDIPLALAPGKSIEINDQYTYVTPVPWNLAIHDPRGKIVFTSFLYEQLRAIKKAVSRCNLSKKFLRQIFYDNAARLLQIPGR